MTRSMLAALLALAFPSLGVCAEQWSTCHTVTAITNYTAHSNTVAAVLSPGIPGCQSDTAGVAYFTVGQMGVTSDSLKSLLASLMSAQMSGTKVMIYYSNATPSCYSSIVSVGGFSAQCL